MESKIFILIDYEQYSGQIISAQVAQLGNTVIYLTDNKLQGYAVAADEPRVRFRYCSPYSSDAISQEIKWTESCLSSLDGVIIVSNLNDIHTSSKIDDLDFNLASRKNDLSVLYIIFTDENSNARSDKKNLESLQRQLFNAAKNNQQLKINCVVMNSNTNKNTNNDIQISRNISALILFLSSLNTEIFRNQTFYFNQPDSNRPNVK